MEDILFKNVEKQTRAKIEAYKNNQIIKIQIRFKRIKSNNQQHIKKTGSYLRALAKRKVSKKIIINTQRIREAYSIKEEKPKQYNHY